MARAINLKNTEHYRQGQGKKAEKIKKIKDAEDAIKTDLINTTWDSLTSEQKDEILKVLAMQAGLVEE